MSRSIILPRRYRVEFAPMSADAELFRFGRFAWRCTLAGAIAAMVFWIAVRTVGRPAPRVTQDVTNFNADLRPSNAKPWMRSPFPLNQPEWIGNPDAN